MSRQLDFSLLIPSRHNIEGLDALFSSICETTYDLTALEVVLAIDQDDLLTLDVSHASLRLVKVILSPGQKMGVLTRACYAASSGRYLFLLNDDVIVQTKNWDLIVKRNLELYPDEIFLVHVNDLIFQDKLCSFPLISKRYCEIVGEVCPENFCHYCIDDHIYAIFVLLAYMGYERRIYLANVIFEHKNYIEIDNVKTPVKDKAIFASDRRKFVKLFLVRNEYALRLISFMEGTNWSSDYEKRYRTRLLLRSIWILIQKSVKYTRIFLKNLVGITG